MTPRIPFAAAVFDLDGTLIDSAPDLREAVNRLLARDNRRALAIEEVTHMIGDGAPKLVERAFAATGTVPAPDELERLTRAFLDFYEGHGAVLTKPYPGVIEGLAALKAAGLRLAVCTNKPQVASDEILAELGLAPMIDVVVGGDTTPARKPDRRHLEAVLARLGIDPRQAVMIGDNANDVAVARAAGVACVAVAWGYPRMAPEELGGDVLIRDMKDLPEALARLS